MRLDRLFPNKRDESEKYICKLKLIRKSQKGYMTKLLQLQNSPRKETKANKTKEQNPKLIILRRPADSSLRPHSQHGISPAPVLAPAGANCC